MLALSRRWFAQIPSHRNFKLLLAGFVISSLGDQLFYFTTLLWLGAVIGRGMVFAPLLAGGVVATGAIASFAVVPFAGVLVDRWDHRRTMLASDVVGLCATAFMALIAVEAANLPFGALVAGTYLVMAVSFVSYYIFGLARVAVTNSVIEPERLAAGNGLFAIAASTVAIVGPAVAAPLLFTLGPAPSFALDAMSFAVSWSLVRLTRIESAPVRSAMRSVIAELRQGLTFAARDGQVRVLITNWSFGALQGAALATLGIFFVQRELHVDVRDLGWLTSGLGAGALIGALLCTWYGDRVPLRRALAISIAALGVILMILSYQTWFITALACYFAAGMSETTAAVLNSVLFQRVVPRGYMGRVGALTVPASTAATIAGASLASGAAVRYASHVNLILETVGVLGLIVAGYISVELWASQQRVTGGCWHRCRRRARGRGPSQDQA